jgi:site-specific recombinase XerD
MEENTIDQNVKDFIESLDVTESTAKMYKRCLEKWFMYLHTKKINVNNPNRMDLKVYRNALSESSSVATVNFQLSAIRQYYTYLHTTGTMSKNISLGLKNIKYDHKISRSILTEEEVRKLLQSIPRKTIIDKRDYALIVLMVTTGLRRIEIQRLTRKDIDFHLWRLNVRRKGRIDKIEFGIGQLALDGIVNYMNDNDYFIIEYYKNVPLFQNHSHNCKFRGLTDRSITRIIKGRLKAIGMNDHTYTAHSLRHTAASIALQNGSQIHEISMMLGHSNLKTTSVYLEALREKIVKVNPAVSVIEKVLNKEPQESHS